VLLRASYIVTSGGNESGVRCEVLDGVTPAVDTTDPIAARDVRFRLYADAFAQFTFLDFVLL
jgi:hypothetical protein